MLTYLTSFNDKIFEVSARHLFKSFADTESEGQLLASSEIPCYLAKFDLNENKTLRNWTQQNLDIIPKSLEGKQQPCTCNDNPEEKAKEKFHKRGCHYTYWNRYVYRWMKKVATLEYALHLETDYLVWLDADCKFLQFTSEFFINDYLKDYDTFYFKGPKRAVEETGIVGYNFRRRGKEIIEALLKRYTSGVFKKDLRWDDCYQYRMVRKELKVNSNDVASYAVTTNPIPETIFGLNICHYKGSHGKAGII